MYKFFLSLLFILQVHCPLSADVGPQPLKRLSDGATSHAIFFSSDESLIFCLDFEVPTECYLKTIDIAKSKRVCTDVGGFVLNMAAAPRAGLLATGDFYGNILFFDAKYATESHSHLHLRGKIQALALSADGNYVAAATEEQIVVYNVKSSECLFNKNISEEVKELALSEDGELLSVANKYRHTLFKTHTGNAIHSLDIKDGYSVEYSPNGKLLALHGKQDIDVYSVSDNRFIFKMQTQTEKYNTITFSPDSRFIAYESDNGEMGVVRTDTGKNIGSYRSPKRHSLLTISPSNNMLCAYVDKGVEFYNIKPLTENIGEAGVIVSMSPNMPQLPVNNPPVGPDAELASILEELQQVHYTDNTAKLYQQRLLMLLPMLKQGANVNITPPVTKGNTALHYACGLCNVRLVDWLLRHGANPNARTNKGATPMQCVTLEVDGHSTYTEYYLIRNMLMQYGAPPPNVPKWS